MKHINIPVFIPHAGCPNDCVFCNQRIISGTEKFVEDDVMRIIDEAVSTAEFATDIGFKRISFEPMSIHAYSLVDALFQC